MKHTSINITDMLTDVIGSVCERCPIFDHVETDRVMVCIASNRKGSRGGTYGKVVPLKFKDGSSLMKYRGRIYSMPEIEHEGKTCFYVIYFFMPRFFDLPVDDKLRVIFHELYHISPDFNGDIRRMGRKKAAHGSSKRHFDSHFTEDLLRYQRLFMDDDLYTMLSMTSRKLYASYGRVIGRRMKVPRPVLLEKN